MEDLTPITRQEMWLDKIADAVSGGGGGGTSDYTQLSNKPQINNVELNGNKSLSDIGAATATDMAAEQDKTTGMSEGGSNYITVGGIRVYVSSTAPTGDIPDGSVGVGW